MSRTLLCPGCRKKPSNQLRPRERQLVRLIVSRALQNKELAYELHLSEGTVKEYLNRAFKKLGVATRSELIVKVHQNPALTSEP